MLPALDDGATSREDSRAMLSALAALGFTTVVATPHQKSGHFMPALDAIRRVHADTAALVQSEGIGLRLALAAENMWDEVFYSRSKAMEIPSYDDGPAFLVELPLGPRLPVGLLDRLFRLRAKGKLPVIAHPERYEPLWKDRGLVDELARECAMQVDLGAVAGYHGRKQGKAARAMLERGQVHAVASDAHTLADVQVAAEGMAWIRKKLGDAALESLLATGPAKILEGQLPD